MEILRLSMYFIAFIFLLNPSQHIFARLTKEETRLLEELEKELEIKMLKDLIKKENEERQPSADPNIILIIADDLGWADVGWNNNEMITHDVMPKLYDLATNGGVILNKYYTEPLCGPSRSAIYSGKYPFRFGGQSNYGNRKRGLPLDVTTLGTRMAEAGYTNHFVGKWHMGHCNSSFTPLGRGYETFLGQYLGAHDDYFLHERNGKFDLRYNATVLEDDTTHTTALYRKRIKEIIDNHDPNDSPLFLVYAEQLIHDPIAQNQVPASFYNKFKGLLGDARLSAYFAMLNMLDSSIENLVSTLQSNSMYDNSVIIFVSDNGQGDIKSSWTSRNNPLREFKGSIFEGAIRVPAFVHSPAYLNQENYVYNGLVYAADIFPTILGLSGWSVSSIADLEQSIDGLDMWASISDNATSRRNTIVRVNSNEAQYYIREGDYKLLKYEETTNSVTEEKIHLYNIDVDQEESNDLKDNETTIYNDLMAKLTTYMSQEVVMSLEPQLAVDCDAANYNNVEPTDCCS